MSRIKFLVIDEKTTKKGHVYKQIYKTDNFNMLKDYVINKGIY